MWVWQQLSEVTPGWFFKLSHCWFSAETLRCHVCDNSDCSNTTSVVCPATHTMCKTITSRGWRRPPRGPFRDWSDKEVSGTLFVFPSLLSVKVNPLASNPLASPTVSKNCSLLPSCITPPNTETEWSVNRGFTRESHTQMCCMSDNCNFQTLASETCSSLLSPTWIHTSWR